MSSGADYSPRRLEMLVTIRLIATFYNLRLLPKNYSITDHMTHFGREFDLQTRRSRGN